MSRKGCGVWGNPWPSQATHGGREVSTAEDLRDDTEPLPLLAPTAAGAAAPSSFAPGGQWWNQIAHVQTSRGEFGTRQRLAVGVVVLLVVIGAAVSAWLLMRPSPTGTQTSAPARVSDLPAPPAAEKTWPDCRVFCRLATPPARAPLPSPQLMRSPP